MYGRILTEGQIETISKADTNIEDASDNQDNYLIQLREMYLDNLQDTDLSTTRLMDFL